MAKADGLPAERVLRTPGKKTPLPRRDRLLVRTLILGLLLVIGFPLAAPCAADRWEPYPVADPTRDFPGGGPWGGWVRRLVSPDRAAGQTLWAATAGGLFTSSDGGQHWQARSAGLERLDVTDVAVCASAPQFLIASTWGGGLYLSSDRGSTWARVPDGELLVGGRRQFSFGRVGIDPTDPLHLLAATTDDSQELFESLDGGLTWRDVGGYRVSRLLFASGGTAYLATEGFRDPRSGSVTTPATVWRMTKGGAPSTVRAFEGAVDFPELVLPGDDGRTLLAALGSTGLWLSEDGGATWRDIGRPVAERLCLEWSREECPECTAGCSADPYSEAFLFVEAAASTPSPAPSAPHRLWFYLDDPAQGKQTSLYESADSGVSFSRVPLAESSQEAWALLSTGAALWLGESKGGAFRFDLAARTWSQESRGLAAYDVLDVGFDPVNAGRLAVAGGGSLAGLSGNGGMYLWDPVWGDWTRRHGDLPGASETFPAVSTLAVRSRGSELWLSTLGYGLYSTRDGGLTWAGSNLPSDVVSSLAFAPGAPMRGVAGTSQDGVFFTDDGGKTWVLGTGTGALQNPVVRPDWRNTRGFVVGGSEGYQGKVYETSDGGKTWGPAGTLANHQIVSFAASDGLAGHWVAGTADDGVYQTLDGGATWLQVAGLPASTRVGAVALALSDGDAVMAAYLAGLGVYVTRDGASWALVTEGLSLPGGAVPLVRGLSFDPVSGQLVAAVQNRGLWALDLDLPPAVRVHLPAAGSSTSATPVLLYAAAGRDVGVWVDGVKVDVASGSAVGPLGGGVHTVRVEATDSRGRKGADEVTFTVSACDPPGVPLVPPEDASGTGSFSVSWTAAATPVGATYELQEATDAAFTENVRSAYRGPKLTATVAGHAFGVTYFYRVRAVAVGYLPSDWVPGENGCRVLRGAVAPVGLLTVPAASAKEGFKVAWKASKTSRVIYELVEAMDPAFSQGLRVIYSGSATSARIYGGSDGVTYYYRVRAAKAEYRETDWAAGPNGCALTLVAVRPRSLSVPKTSLTGAYTVKWGASSTKEASYELQESSDPLFAQSVQTVYTGAGRSLGVTGRPSGTHYYRVRAHKDRYGPSEWRAASKGCVVP